MTVWVTAMNKAAGVPFAADIADRNHDALSINREKIVEVAADFTCRLHFGMDFKSAIEEEGRRLRGQHGPLNGGRARHLRLVAALAHDLLGHSPKALREVEQLGRRLPEPVQNAQIEVVSLQRGHSVRVQTYGLIEICNLGANPADDRALQGGIGIARLKSCARCRDSSTAGAVRTHSGRSRQLGEYADLAQQSSRGDTRELHFAMAGFDANVEIAFQYQVGAVAGFALADEDLAGTNFDSLSGIDKAGERVRRHSPEDGICVR